MKGREWMRSEGKRSKKSFLPVTARAMPRVGGLLGSCLSTSLIPPVTLGESFVLTVSQ